MRSPRAHALLVLGCGCAFLCVLLAAWTIALAALFPSRTIRAELPNGAYLHELKWRSHDDNLVLRSPNGRLILGPDVVRIQHSGQFVFVAHRNRGVHRADWRYLYDVAADQLWDCEPPEPFSWDRSPCRDLLLRGNLQTNPIDTWYDWHRLKRSFGRTWRQPGNGSGFLRGLANRLPFAG